MLRRILFVFVYRLEFRGLGFWLRHFLCSATGLIGNFPPRTSRSYGRTIRRAVEPRTKNIRRIKNSWPLGISCMRRGQTATLRLRHNPIFRRKINLPESRRGFQKFDSHLGFPALRISHIHYAAFQVARVNLCVSIKAWPARSGEFSDSSAPWAFTTSVRASSSKVLPSAKVPFTITGTLKTRARCAVSFARRQGCPSVCAAPLSNDRG